MLPQPKGSRPGLPMEPLRRSLPCSSAGSARRLCRTSSLAPWRYSRLHEQRRLVTSYWILWWWVVVVVSTQGITGINPDVWFLVSIMMWILLWTVQNLLYSVECAVMSKQFALKNIYVQIYILPELSDYYICTGLLVLFNITTPEKIMSMWMNSS